MNNNIIEVTEFPSGNKLEIDIFSIQELAEQTPTFGGGTVVVTSNGNYVVSDRLYYLFNIINEKQKFCQGGA